MPYESRTMPYAYMGEDNTAKEKIAIRINASVLQRLNALSDKSGNTKTTVIEKAIEALDADNKQDHNQIELLSKQNEQMQMVLSASKAVINEKDHVIQSKDKIIQSKDDLIAELRTKRKTFWQKLFGK